MAIATPTSTAFGRWVERHRVLIDVLLMMALFAYDAMYLGVLRSVTGQVSVPVFVTAVILSAGLCLAYTLRRRVPRGTPILACALAWGFVALGVGLSPAPLVVLGLMVYFVAARFSWTAAVPTTAIAAHPRYGEPRQGARRGHALARWA